MEQKASSDAKVTQNEFGLQVVHLSVSESAEQSSFVEIYAYGAHVTFWRESGKPDFLFMSPKAVLNGTKAIRGGIPICFPQFGVLGKLSQHGFARSSVWTISQVSSHDNSASATFTLTSTPATKQLWPHDFEVHYTVTLHGAVNSRLTCSFNVVNPNPQAPFQFTTALHTYFNVNDVLQVGVSPLGGLEYMDNTDRDAEGRARIKSQPVEAGTVTFTGEVDRAYLQASDHLTVVDPSAQRILHVEKSNFDDAVVWNPWADKCAALADMRPDSYLHFVCVEAGAIGRAITLNEHQPSFTASITMYATPLGDVVSNL
eukprot:TRINITY_DN3690_c0_g4_i3.p1 TRINITY_DN3690_c0_g4~~TRINITY_DN3690_c0_g4_i3.p1  ORF type:complete len:341 (-),score=76.11 TRINITY_DN3690_c0_g4_i3:463-1407(-)